MNVSIRPIRGEEDYQRALARVEALIESARSDEELDELDVWATLIDRYETQHDPIDPPSPVEAIRFRMEQAGLEPRDLVPYLGNRARVSEVLAGKRALTLAMIRALTEHLGIPAQSLIGAGQPHPPNSQPTLLDWRRFPLAAMVKRGWLSPFARAKDRAEATIRRLMAEAGWDQAVPSFLYRRSCGEGTNAGADAYALQAWCLQLTALARSRRLKGKYRKGSLTAAFATRLSQLSVHRDGPNRAKDVLSGVGIALVHLPHLPRTRLDGAAFLLPDGRPVIGLTLRYDRVDNFWFTLFHELGHVARHLGHGGCEAFFDDLSIDTASDASDREREANDWAQNALVPPAAWRDSGLQARVSVQAVEALAARLKIHPAIVAGRVRRERRNYRLLSGLVGQGEVRRQLPPDIGA